LKKMVLQFGGCAKGWYPLHLKYSRNFKPQGIGQCLQSRGRNTSFIGITS